MRPVHIQPRITCISSCMRLSIWLGRAGPWVCERTGAQRPQHQAEQRDVQGAALAHNGSHSTRRIQLLHPNAAINMGLAITCMYTLPAMLMMHVQETVHARTFTFDKCPASRALFPSHARALIKRPMTPYGRGSLACDCLCLCDAGNAGSHRAKGASPPAPQPRAHVVLKPIVVTRRPLAAEPPAARPERGLARPATARTTA
jgi:hypothetical protein